MSLLERGPQPARRGRPTRRRLGIAAANLSLVLAISACGTEPDPAPSVPNEATSTTVATFSEQPTGTIDTGTAPTPMPRIVTAEVAKKWCDNATIQTLAMSLFPGSENALCNAQKSSIGFAPMTVGDDLNTYVVVAQSPVPLDTIGATSPGYTCDETQCSRKDTGDVGVYIKAPDGLTIRAAYHNLAARPGLEQGQYETLTTLARTAMDLVP